VLGADSSWADPVVVDVDAALEHNIDHVFAAGGVVVNLDASLFPGMDHLLLAEPLTGKHDAVMRWLVQVQDVLEAELNALMGAAKSRVAVVDGCGEVSLQDVTVVHLNLFTVEETVHVESADVVRVGIDALVVRDVSHILFTDELVMDAEAAAVVEGVIEVTRAHQGAMLVPVAVMGSVLTVGEGGFVVLVLVAKVLNNDGLARADPPALSLNTLAQEELNALLVAHINVGLHVDARSLPEVIQVFLAKPLRGRLRVELVLSLDLDTLVVLHVKSELIVADHSVTEKTVLVASLFLLVVHELVGEVVLNGLVQLLNMLGLVVGQGLLSRGHVLQVVVVILVMAVSVMVAIVVNMMLRVSVAMVVVNIRA